MAHSPRTGFEEFYLARRSSIRGVFVRRGVVGTDADDLTAEVFEAVWRRWAETPGRTREAWTYGVARNVLHTYRRRALRETMTGWPVTAPVPAASDPVVAMETATEVRAALATLSATDRDLLLAVVWDGLTPRDAAVALALPAATVRVRLHRARKRFARAYTEVTAQQTIDIREHVSTGVH